MTAVSAAKWQVPAMHFQSIRQYHAEPNWKRVVEIEKTGKQKCVATLTVHTQRNASKGKQKLG